MQKTDYPLSLLRSLKILKEEFKKLIFQNENIIEQSSGLNSNSILHLAYKENKRFYFAISNPKLTGDFRSVFSFGYIPQDENLAKATSYNDELSIVLEHFNIWISLLREYDELNLDDDDTLIKFYEDEFFHEFEILDDDAFTAPFEHKKQIVLCNFLTYIESELKKQGVNDPEIKILIEETIALKDNIQNFPKKIAIRKFSRILAKIKKKALPIIMEIIEEAKKEAIKKIITGGFDEVTKLIHHIF